MKSWLLGLATLVAVAVLLVLGHMAFIEIGREVVTLRTQRSDGTWQESRLWIVDDGATSWLHSAGEGWVKRFEENPEVEVERDGRIQRYRAQPVPGPHARVDELLREKYGLADRWVRFIAPDNEKVVVVRLDAAVGPRAGPADFAGRVDILNDRQMYLERRGTGSPTVVLVSGLDAAADLWNRDGQKAPTVFTQVAEFTRVYAYDRPGTPSGAGLPSRSDPVTQPTTPEDAVADLHALLQAAEAPGPYVLVGHSYGGLVTRLYASTYPEEVCGMVLVDILSDGLRDAMTPRQWEIWKRANARMATDIAEYPALERIDFDLSMDQVKVAAPIRPMPLLVLSADALYGPLLPSLIEAGELPPDTPPDLGYVVDSANRGVQANLATLVPGAKHVTDTHSGHNMMIDQPQLVTDSIREVVDAVRHGRSALSY